MSKTSIGVVTFAKVLAFAITIGLAGIQLWQIARPAARLSAQLTFSDWQEIPLTLEGLSDTAVRRVLKKRAVSSGLSGIRADSFSDRAIADLREARGDREIVRGFRLNLASGYWDGVVQNTGSTELRNVRITFSNATYACATPLPEHRLQCAPPNGHPVALGDLQPRENVTVFAWSGSRPSSYNRSLDEPVLTHSAGLGSVRVRLPASAWIAALDKNWIVVFFTAVTLVALLYSIATMSQLAWKMRSWKKRDGDRKKPNES